MTDLVFLFLGQCSEVLVALLFCFGPVLLTVTDSTDGGLVIYQTCSICCITGTHCTICMQHGFETRLYDAGGFFWTDKGREWWKGVGLAQDTCKFFIYLRSFCNQSYGSFILKLNKERKEKPINETSPHFGGMHMHSCTHTHATVSVSCLSGIFIV